METKAQVIEKLQEMNLIAEGITTASLKRLKLSDLQDLLVKGLAVQKAEERKSSGASSKSSKRNARKALKRASEDFRQSFQEACLRAGENFKGVMEIHDAILTETPLTPTLELGREKALDRLERSVKSASKSLISGINDASQLVKGTLEVSLYDYLAMPSIVVKNGKKSVSWSETDLQSRWSAEQRSFITRHCALWKTRKRKKGGRTYVVAVLIVKDILSEFYGDSLSPNMVTADHALEILMTDLAALAAKDAA